MAYSKTYSDAARGGARHQTIIKGESPRSRQFQPSPTKDPSHIQPSPSQGQDTQYPLQSIYKNAKALEISVEKMGDFIYYEMQKAMEHQNQLFIQEKKILEMEIEMKHKLELQKQNQNSHQRECRLKLSFSQIGQRWLLENFFKDIQEYLTTCDFLDRTETKMRNVDKAVQRHWKEVREYYHLKGSYPTIPGDLLYGFLSHQIHIPSETTIYLSSGSNNSYKEFFKQLADKYTLSYSEVDSDAAAAAKVDEWI